MRDFLKIPYVYTVPDDFDKDSTDYASDSRYQEDLAVDKELQKIAMQAADFIFRNKGLCLKDMKFMHRWFKCFGGEVLIQPSPVFAVNSFVVDGAPSPITFERGKGAWLTWVCLNLKALALSFRAALMFRQRLSTAMVMTLLRMKITACLTPCGSLCIVCLVFYLGCLKF